MLTQSEEKVLFDLLQDYCFSVNRRLRNGTHKYCPTISVNVKNDILCILKNNNPIFNVDLSIVAYLIEIRSFLQDNNILKDYYRPNRGFKYK